MLRAPKVGDIDDELNILITKLRLTNNEYNATIRNKLEYNRLKVINRHINDQIDMNAYKVLKTICDLKERSNDNQRVICNLDTFINRKVK